MIHFHPVSWEVRVYKGDADSQQQYDNRDDWVSSVLIRRFGDTLWASMFQGEFDRKMLRKLQEWARDQGVTAIEWDGNGKVQHLKV